MSSIGSGVGGGIGGPQQPSVREQEQTAATEALKLMAGLSLLKDTLEIPFSQMGGNIWKYQSNASRPALPPLTSTRGPASFEDLKDTSWKKNLENLVNLIPSELKSDYLAEMNLPLDQRNIDFVAFDNVLTTTAMTLSWLQEATGPSLAEGVASIDALLNMAMPHLALEGMIRTANLVLSKATNFLDNSGANYLQQDILRNFVRHAEKGIAEIENLQSEMKSSKSVIEGFATLAAKLTAISQEFDRLYTGSDLKILGITLASMASLSAALAFADPGTPSLFLALTVCSIGLNVGTSEAAIIGPAIEASSSAISGALSGLLIPNASLATQQFMDRVVTTVFLGAIAFSTLVNEVGVGYLPGDEVDVKNAKAFTFDIVVTLLASSQALDGLLSSLTDRPDLSPKQHEYLTESLKLVALTTIIIAAAPNRNPNNAASLFDSLQGTISKSLAIISDMVNEGILNHTMEGETTVALGISLQQTQIALNDSNMSEFVDALKGTLALIGLNSDQFMNDVSLAGSYVDHLTQALTMGVDDKTNTDTRMNFIA